MLSYFKQATNTNFTTINTIEQIFHFILSFLLLVTNYFLERTLFIYLTLSCGYHYFNLMVN